MKYLLVMLLGVILIVGSVWGGAFLFHVIGSTHPWIKLPVSITAVLLWMLGVVIFLLGSLLD